MKQCYPKNRLFLTLFTLLFYLSNNVSAQCLCSDGTPANTEVHNYSVSFPSNTTTTLSVPQFQPASGTLVCVNAKILLTSILRMKLENNDINPVDYLVRYVRNDTF